MATTKRRQEEIDTARASLMEVVKPGDTIYTVLRHRSASGMSRSISLIKLYQREDGTLDTYHLDYHVSRLLGYQIDQRHEGIKVSVVGMDMGFHLVNSLSCALFCPDKYDHDAAYSLKHRWM